MQAEGLAGLPVDPTSVSVDRKRSRPTSADRAPSSGSGSGNGHCRPDHDPAAAAPPHPEVLDLLRTLTTGMSEVGGHVTAIRGDLAGLASRMDAERERREAEVQELREGLREERAQREQGEQRILAEVDRKHQETLRLIEGIASTAGAARPTGEASTHRGQVHGTGSERPWVPRAAVLGGWQECAPQECEDRARRILRDCGVDPEVMAVRPLTRKSDQKAKAVLLALRAEVDAWRFVEAVRDRLQNTPPASAGVHERLWIFVE